MSITTERGDQGETDLLFGQRVAKDDPRVEAGGAVDELNSVLGVVRTHLPNTSHLVPMVDLVQADLVGLMGQVAVLPQDKKRYLDQGFPSVGPEQVERLTQLAAETENRFLRPFSDWARPGGSGEPAAAFLDLARTVCRRAERRLAELKTESGGLEQAEGLRFLNRLSDLLWLWARELEEQRLGHTAAVSASR